MNVTERSTRNAMPDQGSGSRAAPAARILVLAALLGLGLSPAARAADPYSLGPGDLVQITVYAGGEKQVDFTGAVSALGTITSPLIGEFKVAGLTTYEVERTMREVLARDYYVDPQVLVSVKEYGGQIFVMGAVKKPGAYGLQERMTVLGACLLAEGFTDFASPRRVKVTRMENGKQRTIKIDLIKVREGKKEDLPLQRGDRIEVPRRRF
jgi:protein involved in polysaccharide export with SLBB domain